jgi:hypothetical protein
MANEEASKFRVKERPSLSSLRPWICLSSLIAHSAFLTQDKRLSELPNNQNRKQESQLR